MSLSRVYRFISRSILFPVSYPAARYNIKRSVTVFTNSHGIRGELHSFQPGLPSSVEVYLEFVSTRPTFGFGPAKLTPTVGRRRIERRSARNTGANYRLTFGTADLHRGSIHARHMRSSDSHWVSYPNRTFRTVAFEFEIGLNRTMRVVSHSSETADLFLAIYTVAIPYRARVVVISLFRSLLRVLRSISHS